MEGSIKRAGIPMFALDYRAWRMGPVAKEVFVDLSGDVTVLKDFIRVVRDDRGGRIEAVRPFSDDEFSDRDMELLENMTGVNERASSELIDVTHDRNSLWYQLAVEKRNTGAIRKWCAEVKRVRSGYVEVGSRAIRSLNE